MRILYVGPYPPAPDGIGTYTYAFAQVALSQGHSVAVVVPGPTPDSPTHVIGALCSRIHGLTELCNKIKTWEPDVVHVQFAVAAYGTRTVALLRWLGMLRGYLSARIIVTMHEVTRETSLLGPVGQVIYRRIAALTDRIIVHTSAAEGALIGRLGIREEKVEVIPHPSTRPPAAGSTPEMMRARFRLEDARILLAFGFIHVDKGLGDLVRALGLLNYSQTDLLNDVQLVVAGAVRPRSGIFRMFEAWDRIHLARVLRQVRRLSLQDHLVLTGFVPDEDIAAWFQAADAAVLPYRHAEQSGVAGLAAAFGLPVLASTAGGLGEQYAGSRWAFPPGNPERLADVLADFLFEHRRTRETVTFLLPDSDIATIAETTFKLYQTSEQGGARSSLHAR